MEPPGKDHTKSEDQLKTILETLGQQDALDLSFISRPDSIDHTKALQSNSPKIDF